MDRDEVFTAAIAVLSGTEDGEGLSPRDLWIVQEAVNGHLNAAGLVELARIRDAVVAGTYRPGWLHGIEHLTKDHDGYVLWKGEPVEHYSFAGDAEAEKRAAERLAERCRFLEEAGSVVTMRTVHTGWGMA